MEHKTLALVLAAGEGSRIKHLLQDDEPVKPMLKVGKRRLIEIVLKEAEKVGDETAVLTYPSELYESLDQLVRNKGIRILKQKAKHRKLPHLLELAYIIRKQYLSADQGYLASFDSIATFSSDIVFIGTGTDFKAMADFHKQSLSSPNDRQITILSKKRAEGRTYNFKVENGRLTSVQWLSTKPAEGYYPYVSPGVYIFTRAVLKNSFGFLLGLDYNKVLIFETKGTWIDYGNPKTF